MRSLALLVLAVGCSSPGGSPSQPDPDATTDSAKPIDASIDALLGNACPTSATEVARISGADIFPQDVGPAYYTTATGSFYTTDADGDGDKDLLVFEEVSSSSTSYTYRTRLFKWTGSAFATPVTSTLTIPAYGIERDLLADIDGDHRKDLVLGYTTEYPRTPYVYVAMQAADGSFSLQSTRIDLSPCGSSSDQRLEAIAIYDLDRDGKDDVLATASFGGLGSAPAGLAVAKGTSTGLGSATCIASSSVSTPGIPAELAIAKKLLVGDFDGDGAKDLVSTGYQNAMAKSWMFRATGASQLALAPMISTMPMGRMFVDHVAGRAKDGLIDVYLDTNETQIFRYATDSQGISAEHKILDFPVGSSSDTIYGFSIADFNGDGLTDVVEIGDRHYQSGPTPLQLGCDRAGAWQPTQATLPENTSILRAIDFDSDASSELVARVGTDVVVYDLH